jgi:hypothetical protein
LVQVGRARIEFHGDNLAETVEEEREAAAREERQARYWDHYFHSYNSHSFILHYTPRNASLFSPVLRIRIRRIRMFFAPPGFRIVRGVDPDPYIIKQNK